MDQNAQTAVVEHEPGHEFSKESALEGNLVHGAAMRPNLHIMPPPKAHKEALCHFGAKPESSFALFFRTKIDMRVPACDAGNWVNARG
jgi:hypothetical protein